MARIPYRIANPAARASRGRNPAPTRRTRPLGSWVLAAVAGLPSPSQPAAAHPPLRDAPVLWYDDDARDIKPPAERDPDLLWDSITEGFLEPVGRATHPGRTVRRVGTL